jgi:hypothetical protein
MMSQNGPKFINPFEKKRDPISGHPNFGKLQHPQPVKMQANTEGRVEIPKDPLAFKELFGFRPDEVNILICTPCYGGQLFNSYFHSIIETMNFLSAINIKFGLKTIANESLITRARNTCVSYFLSHDEYTHLMFIDADIAFPHDAILKLLRANKDITAAIYPKKTYRFDRLPQLFKMEPNTWLQDTEAKLLDYVVNFYDPKAQIINNCIRVKDAPTGFMLIQRQVFDDMKIAYPDLQYNNDLALDETQHRPDTFWLFFDCIKDPQDGRYLSEDYAFCRLAQHINKECWVDVTIPLSHTGMHKYKGNLLSIFDIHG